MKNIYYQIIIICPVNSIFEFLAMENIDVIAGHYKNMSDAKLAALANEPRELRMEVLPVLQLELINRGLTDQAMAISHYLIQTKVVPDFGSYSMDELKKLVSERIDSGESVESIKIDLKDHGINLFDILSQDENLREQSLNYLTELKSQGLSEEEIDEKMEETLSIEKNEIEMLKSNLRLRGKRNLAIGFTCLAFVLLIFVSGLSLTIGGVLLAGIAVWQIYKGFEQTRK